MRPRRIRLKAGTPEFDKDLDTALEDIRDQLSDTPLGDTVFIKDVIFADGVSRLIPHGLGRAWQGWKIANLEGASTAGVIQHVRGEDKTRFLQLQADGYGADITVNLEIY